MTNSRNEDGGEGGGNDSGRELNGSGRAVVWPSVAAGGPVGEKGPFPPWSLGLP